MQLVEINATSRALSQGRNGVVKDINGVNGAPISFMPGFPDLQDQFNQLGISHVRFHDIFGPGDIENAATSANTSNNQLLISVPSSQKSRANTFIVDIMNERAIFPHAVEGMRQNNLTLASSEANWAPTDYYIRETLNNIEALNPEHIQRDIMIRIGRSNNGGNAIPPNFEIYAELVALIVERYSANISLSQIPRKVAYWEIWNEPDLIIFWSGSQTQFYRLYETVARRIKAVDLTAKVGGPGVADGESANGAYTGQFLQYCQRNSVPLDFFSWHYYAHRTTDPLGFENCANTQRQNLDKYGFVNAESICSEWNVTPFSSRKTATSVQTVQNAAFIAASFITMNKCAVDKAYYYRGDAGFLGLFNDNPNPRDTEYRAFCTYAAQAFGLYKQMFGTPNLLVTPDLAQTNYYVLAGLGSNAVNVLVANFRKDTSIASTSGLPPGGVYFQQNYVDSGRTLDQITDAWSLEHWFGQGALKTARSKPVVAEPHLHKASPSADVKAVLDTDARQSSDGPLLKATDNDLKIEVSNLPTSAPKLEVRRVTAGGDLGAILPPVNNSGVTVTTNATTISISDAEATAYTVTLYSIIW